MIISYVRMICSTQEDSSRPKPIKKRAFLM
jgi:hypothetical protein